MKLRNSEADASPLGFRCPADLRAAIERQAASEGISASDVVRRATIRDLRFARKEEAADAAPLPRISMPSTPWTRSR